MDIFCTILAGAIDWLWFCVSIGHGGLNGWRFERLPVQNDLRLAQGDRASDLWFFSTSADNQIPVRAERRQ
ncbi:MULTISPECIES: hypothetical protein [Agrobacterium tumefaciens complex]|uniref:hypothetical protein n=1 Tax=Agrobacterium tumefaciens complex TaxID=1183400 RepID=UPI0013AF2AAC|nr:MULTISPECIES: hypothetical protein [Agrobacterium tumefaciens complex]MBB4408085.1 hypothetical protein [Agrobacterium radiobacter]MBB4453456.1 hypothetical protein [Agrobacterium radiobacter]MDP9873895.1 hypothetical protein [Agrobacterium tumefaciens]MDP9979058.1 hypothetical protein [Agrobacterium tumefaciens]